MKNTLVTKKRSRTSELESFHSRILDLTKFKADFPQTRLRELFGPAELVGQFAIFLFPIDTLSVTKTVGRGRTNLTFIRPTIVQADAAIPFAGFDRTQSLQRAPAIQMHFAPQAYGITAVSHYLMEFTVETFGPATFRVDGSFGFVSNAGSIAVNGRRIVTLAFQNVPPSEQIFGFIEQTAGERWNWFSVAARFPYPVLTSDL